MSKPPVLSLPQRVLMGPGPSSVPASVLAAMALPTIGHLDPAFLRVMDELREMLRTVFGTQNPRPQNAHVRASSLPPSLL